MLMSQDPQTLDLSDSFDNYLKILSTLSVFLVQFATTTTLLFYCINLVFTINANFLWRKSFMYLNNLSQIEQKC